MFICLKHHLKSLIKLNKQNRQKIEVFCFRFFVEKVKKTSRNNFKRRFKNFNKIQRSIYFLFPLTLTFFQYIIISFRLRKEKTFLYL